MIPSMTEPSQISKKNTCDGCTLCCKLLEIPELNKPVNEYCSLCKVNSGCSIYNTRPQSCRDFNCLYITHNLTERLKPKNCHVVFEKLKDCPVYLALIDPDYPQALESEAVKVLIMQLLQDNFSVVTTAGAGRVKNFFLAQDTTQAEVWTHITRNYKQMKV